MNHQLRIFYHTLTAISLLFCVGAIGAWIWTYRAGRELQLAARENVMPDLPVWAAEHAGPWTTYRWIGSSGGRIQFVETTMTEHTRSLGPVVNGHRYPIRILRALGTYWVLNTPSTSPEGPRYQMPQGNFIRTSVAYYTTPARLIGGNLNGVVQAPPPFVLLQQPVAGSRPPNQILSRPTATQPVDAKFYSMGGVVWSAPYFTVASSVRTLIVSWWLITVATALLPAFWTIRWLRRRGAVRRNACINCGYDLRATPQRCPECGVVPGHSRL